MKKNLIIFLLALIVASCQTTTKQTAATFDEQVQEYLQKFPYQETHNYIVKYTGGNPAALNKLITDSAELLKAGNDIVVRSNNDTYYTGGFLYLAEGPVKLGAAYADPSRFYSFQLMDDRNCNFSNIINPEGDYYLYYGEKPEGIEEGELIESPSEIVSVLIRVEVKDPNDPEDVAEAQKVFYGITASGPEIGEFPELDLLGSYDSAVAKRANELMDSVFANVALRELVAAPDQVPDEVSWLYLASGTKAAWGGPVAEHSTYETMFYDENGALLDGSRGPYTLTTKAPPVDAFWSVTVYDTKRGGYFHPNKDDRYHINNTTAVPNDDGTYTFTFKTECTGEDVNCLEVPPGQFDLAIRYYLPQQPLIDGIWKMPVPKLVD
jgi:hypothetical protein